MFFKLQNVATFCNSWSYDCGCFLFIFAICHCINIFSLLYFYPLWYFKSVVVYLQVFLLSLVNLRFSRIFYFLTFAFACSFFTAFTLIITFSTATEICEFFFCPHGCGEHFFAYLTDFEANMIRELWNLCESLIGKTMHQIIIQNCV